jgi:uncharacterized protein involved in oxidation of intracellular sulfur
MKYLAIFHDPPYGSERTYNGLRLVLSLSRQQDVALKLFLMGDSVLCAKSGQKVPSGFYNVQIMLEGILKRGASVGICGTCADARGIGDHELTAGVRRSTMDELTAWTMEADKVVNF